MARPRATSSSPGRSRERRPGAGQPPERPERGRRLITTGRLVIQPARAVYMPDGAFDPDAMLDNLRDLTAQALKPTWTPVGERPRA